MSQPSLRLLRGPRVAVALAETQAATIGRQRLADGAPRMQ
jgi:hypothetical protein